MLEGHRTPPCSLPGVGGALQGLLFLCSDESARRAAFGPQASGTPGNHPVASGGLCSLSQRSAGWRTSQSRPGQTPHIPGGWGDCKAASAFPSTPWLRQTVAPTETKSTNEGKECKRNTWEGPTRRTLAHSEDMGSSMSPKMVPKSAAQVCIRLSASAFKYADPRTD